MQTTTKILNSTHGKEVGMRKVRCPKCGKKHYIPIYVKDLVCEDCYERDEFDNDEFTSTSWNFQTKTKAEDVSKNTFIDVK